jgi:hypothetical protein
MKHGVRMRKLNRTGEHRWAMLRYSSFRIIKISIFIIVIVVVVVIVIAGPVFLFLVSPGPLGNANRDLFASLPFLVLFQDYGFPTHQARTHRNDLAKGVLFPSLIRSVQLLRSGSSGRGGVCENYRLDGLGFVLLG